MKYRQLYLLWVVLGVAAFIVGVILLLTVTPWGLLLALLGASAVFSFWRPMWRNR